MLPKLDSLAIQFESPTSDPKRRNRPLPPQTQSVLHSLTKLVFQGVSEYLEVLAARIDAPLLKFDQITFFNQPVFDIPQIIRFSGHLDSFRTSSLTLRFNLNPVIPNAVLFHMEPHQLASVGRRCSWHILCNNLDGQVFSLAQICSQIPSFRSSVESLEIEYAFWGQNQPEIDIDPTVWLRLFQSFPSVQSLEISSYLERSIAATLGGLTEESAADVFPSLHSLVIVPLAYTMLQHIDTTPQLEDMQSFVAARQHSVHPVAVSRKVRTS
jgi:hypothetical protein